MLTQIKITYRGWGGHFIACSNCLFRLNTLIEVGEKRVVVSTVGNFMVNGRVEQIGPGRYFETMAWPAKLKDLYWEADIEKPEIQFEYRWRWGKEANENDVNEGHARIVEEIVSKLLQATTL